MTNSSELRTTDWVVGVDGSECSTSAAKWAAVHADGRAGAIRLVAAWSIPAAPMCPPFDPVISSESGDAVEAGVRAEVEMLAQKLSVDLRVPVETSIVRGGSSSVLLDAAADAGLLVVGSRGKGGFARLLVGSTSTQCATHASVPTVVVREGWSDAAAQHLVVAIDGSENSLAALRWALTFAGPSSRVDVVTVWDVSPIVVGADQFFFPEASDLAHDRFDHLVDTAQAAAGRNDVTVDRTFLEGRPRADLAAAAEDADLFVMGARGHGALGSAVLGSVSTWLLHHVSTPIAVVPNVR